MRSIMPALYWIIPVTVLAVVFSRDAGASTAASTVVEALASELDARVASTLQAVQGTDRKLLALRSYLRAGSDLAQRWSWTAEQISQYLASDEHRLAEEQIARITAAFERDNPGYTLYVNRTVRSLELQTLRWNQNESVGKVAAALLRDFERRFSTHSRRSAVTAAQAARFLMSWTPPMAAALAAPGLSRHGQSRAFDFQIQKAGRIVAGTSTAKAASEWDAAGWTAKLKAAIAAAAVNFTGPLQHPYEPWHYHYHR